MSFPPPSLNKHFLHEWGGVMQPLDFSFEMFPPKTDAGLNSFLAAYRAFAAVNPTTISLTFGAGGSGRSRSLDALEALSRSNRDAKNPISITAHLTCVGFDQTEALDMAHRLVQLGADRLLVLGGDPIDEGSTSAAHYAKTPIRYAADLIDQIVNPTDKPKLKIGIGCAAFPEGRPNGETAELDLAILKSKCDAGASFAWTQFFFDDEAFLRYLSLIHI